MSGLHEAVSRVMQEVGRDVLMRYFRTLARHEIEEKTPGDLVTIADHTAEERLSEALVKIVPGSHMVGEEAATAHPACLYRVTHGTAWIVDPLDGTGNFAIGETPFACMVALAVDGVIEAGWILDPVSGRMCHAQRGQGATIDGETVRATGTGSALPVGALLTRFLPPTLHEPVLARAAGHIEVVPIPGCAGEQYPRLVLGQNDLALFWNVNPWDHAPGALFLEEAGGRIGRLDGTPYRLGEDRPGLLAASSPALWERGREILLADPLPFP